MNDIVKKQILNSIFMDESGFQQMSKNFMYLEDLLGTEYIFTIGGKFLFVSSASETFGNNFVGGWGYGMEDEEYFLYRDTKEAQRMIPSQGNYWVVSPMWLSDDKDIIWIKDDTGMQYQIDMYGNITKYGDD